VEYEGQEYTTQEEIEEILLPINEANVKASDHTPFMQAPLLAGFGYQEQREAHEQILQGTYEIPEGCDQATTLLIQGMKRPQDMPFKP
jgi:hypothetical protein